MAIKKLNPYLLFDGTAEKAIKLYEKALGAKVEGLMRYGDVPAEDHTPEHKALVMHATLQLGAGVIMLSDRVPGRPGPRAGDAHILLDFDDAADMAEKFNALAAGGEVAMGLHDTFWGARYGMLKDAFSVWWSFNCELKKA